MRAFRRWHRRWHEQHGGRLWQRRRPQLRRQLFAWLVLTIFSTGVAVFLVLRVAGDRRQAFDLRRAEGFVAEHFALTWDDPALRRAAAESLSRTIQVDVLVRDAAGRAMTEVGSCVAPDHSISVRRGTAALGRVDICVKNKGFNRAVSLLAFVTAFLVLWKAASALARFLTRPLSQLIGVTREIGAGNLKSRVRLHRAHRGELGFLADAINDMAERIERQLTEQRELLAAVSHEVRSPLARLRISSELLRENPRDARALASIESEVDEIDTLVGKLLANSRLDFGTLTRAPLDAASVGRTALARQSLPLDRLADESNGARFSADPTLIARALDNLLDNAIAHGGGLSRLVVRRARPGEHAQAENSVVFEAWDEGPGFDKTAQTRAFEAFFRGANAASDGRASLGLGLALVQRIAAAHGGRAWAENLPNGGARVCFSAG
ncbi:MAG TPA: HAMP domain-containing sensor histidine kinase [Polyangiaceae bacterium]|nr:HAMP domain-containing sensor histidine kinase [Polyangiaceae bacterium]